MGAAAQTERSSPALQLLHLVVGLVVIFSLQLLALISSAQAWTTLLFGIVLGCFGVLARRWLATPLWILAVVSGSAIAILGCYALAA